ncbi:sigma-70 family RNA polymerase sigma factor [Streptomyces sp. SID5785]|uniref:sigma-70 family RNA polymerase sigma factor n=1 Tax=Streptomyces sp. SID5785 TaxID=2690309 RepID=UPI0013613E1D|nr:sigma-70 family RNA polymerase sigma factor [Streptomyces sp. SID5785]MZD07875.1 sigma-70 family RNA polymerase sigma factor [Streptomyces sp. SID5785]
MSENDLDNTSDAQLTSFLHRSEGAQERADAGRGTDAGMDTDTALEELYRRHRPAVVAYARLCCRDPHTAEDLASEAFARTLQAVQGGEGPKDAWRPYLLTVVRRTAAQWAATARRTELSPDFEQWVRTAGTDAADPDGDGEGSVLAHEDASLVRQGFRALPERWRAVLWHTVVENESAGQVGRMLGLSASGVTSLAARAREGLREAYLTAHLEGADEECRRYAALLGSRVRRTGRNQSRELERHLDGCARCRRSLLELTELSERMRSALPVALLLWGSSGYLAARWAAGADAAGQPGPSGGGPDGRPPSEGSSGTTAQGGPGHTLLSRAGAHPVGVGVAGVAVAALIASGVFMVPDGGTERAAPRSAPAAPSSAPAVTATVTESASPSPSQSDAPSRRPSASGPAKPSASASPTWQPASALDTTLRIAATDRCMEPADDGLREAACTGAAGQQWELSWDVGDDGERTGTLHVRNHASDSCLAFSGRDEDGAPVTSQPCRKDASHQSWKAANNGDEHKLTLIDAVSGHYLGLNDWWPAGRNEAHDDAIGTTPNYYGTQSLRLLYKGTLA